MNQLRTSGRFLLLTVLILGNASCLIGRVWMVDHRYEAVAMRGQRGGEVPLRIISSGDKTDLVAVDGDTKFSFEISPGKLLLKIHNNGAEALRLDLDEAYFLDPQTEKHELTVVQVESFQQRVYRIPPHGTLELRLWPTDWARKNKGRLHTWIGDSLFGGSTIYEPVSDSKQKAISNHQEDIGKSFEVHLSLRSGEHLVPYRFKFTAKGLFATKVWWA